MKKLIISTLAIYFLMIATVTAQGQAPYKHSIGVTTGNLTAVSYKTFLSEHLALQADLGYKYIVTAGQKSMYNIAVQTLELNPNVMYEKDIIKGLYIFGGGGVSLGYSWSTYYDLDFYYRFSYGKFGVNAITGAEYKFEKIPLSLQADFRPGYGLLFSRRNTWSYFDWSLCASARYTF